MERFDTVLTGKGYALKWCIEQLIDSARNYDAFVVIDADTFASSDLLTVLNSYLLDGAECVQCSDMVLPQPGSWSPEMTRVAFILHNYVRPLGKMAVGCSATLFGNGMCFSKHLLKTTPWKSFSRVEDLERSLELALENIQVVFAPEAMVRAIMPTDPRNAETQRKRWEMGRFPLIKKYAGPLLLGAVRKRSLMMLDAFIDLVTPAFVNLTVLTTSIVALHLLLIACGLSMLDALAAVWILILAMEVFHVFGGLKAAHADKDAYRALYSFPRFIFWKLKVYAKTWLKGDDKLWVRTARESHNDDGAMNL